MKKVVIIESFTHHIPTGLGFIEGLNQLGYQTYSLPTTHYSINNISEEVDIIINLGWPNINEIKQFKSEFPNTKIAILIDGWNDCVLDLKQEVDVWFGLSYKADLLDIIYQSYGLTLHHIPLGASSERFKPLNIEKQYDLSFIGQFGKTGHGYRHEDIYLYPLMDLGLKGLYSGFDGYPFVLHTDLNKIYNQTKININFHYWYQKEQNDNPQAIIDFNGRVFEIALAGGFQLCDHPYIKEYLGNGIIYSDKENWKETFNYYLNNPEEREYLSKIAQQNVLQNHTWKSRMELLINILEKL